MTLPELTHYIEVGLAVGAVLAPTIGIIGHALAALPWAPAKTLGNALNAISVDFGDLKNAAKNAKEGVDAKKGGGS